MKKAARTLCLSFAALAAGLLLLEGAWFGYVLGRPQPPLRADMLAVYGGVPGRYEAGWTIERQGNFTFLVFSDAEPGDVSGMDHRFGPPRHAQILLEPRARTTAQNARYVAQLIRDRGCQSVLVVTSWWHLPRALFLTHLALLGSGVSIAGVASDHPPMPVWEDLNTRMELVRFWGSLLTYFSDTRRASDMLRHLVQ